MEEKVKRGQRNKCWKNWKPSFNKNFYLQNYSEWCIKLTKQLYSSWSKKQTAVQAKDDWDLNQDISKSEFKKCPNLEVKCVECIKLINKLQENELNCRFHGDIYIFSWF